MDVSLAEVISRLTGKPTFLAQKEAVGEARNRHKRVAYDRMESIFRKVFRGAETASAIGLHEFFNHVAAVDENEARLERFASDVGFEPGELLDALSLRARRRMRMRNGDDGEIASDVLFDSVVRNGETLAMAPANPLRALNRVWVSVRNEAIDVIRHQRHVHQGEPVMFLAVDEARDIERGAESIDEMLSGMATDDLVRLTEELLQASEFDARDVVIFREYIVGDRDRAEVEELVGLGHDAVNTRRSRIVNFLGLHAEPFRMLLADNVSTDARWPRQMGGE